MRTRTIVTALLLMLCSSLGITACQVTPDDKVVPSAGGSGPSGSVAPGEVNSPEATPSGQDAEGTPLTREWIMDHYGLTEDDVDGYDIDLMIKHGYLARDKMLRRYPAKEDLLDSLPWLHEHAYETEHADELSQANDYTYLLEGSDGFPEPYERIRFLGIESVWDDRQPNETDPTGKVSALFDLQEGKAYFKATELSVLDDLRTATSVVELTDDDIARVRQLLDETEFSQWPAQQVPDGEYDSWTYGVESVDGEVYSNQVRDLPNNERAWKLFVELFGYATNFPILSK
ncbi:MAG: hypothetical protein Q4F67_17550 [Propionibacteriaceae bacterium]|nr:hypothetical protein [Propionibacteriaceae bacterium]